MMVLSRITHSTEGEIRLRGSTGRENIYFNDAIMGMKKREIDEKFDDIVRFVEIDKYPTKPMMNIGNQPILWYIMKLYIYYGFNDFILSLGYKGNIIIEYFCNYEIFNIDFLRILEVPRFYVERLYKYE